MRTCLSTWPPMGRAQIVALRQGLKVELLLEVNYLNH
jgi:hypothetical protein